MALAFVQSDSGTATNADAITAGITTTNGNALIVAVGVFNNSNQSLTVTDNKSNTFTKAITKYDNASTDMRVDIWYSLNITGGAGHTVTVGHTGSGRWTALVNEWSGVANSGAFDQSASATAVAADISTGNTGTLATANEMVFVATTANAGNPGVGTGYSNYLNVTNGVSYSIESKIVSSTTAVSGDFATGASNFVAVAATFEGSPGTTTSTSISTSSTSSSTSTSSTSSSTSFSSTSRSTSSSTSRSTSTSFSTSSTSISSTSSSTSTSFSTSSTSSSTSMSSTSTSTSTTLMDNGYHPHIKIRLINPA